MNEVLLEVKNLKTQFQTDEGHFFAVDNVSFNVHKGRTLGIVGESGCGKSVTSLSIMGLISSPGKITNGEILYRGQNLLHLQPEEMRKLRGGKISMIFQEPMTSLNPVFSIGNQIEEAVREHNPQFNQKQIYQRTLEMLKLVNIPAPEQRYHEYPHQLSGGMRQRVMIAMAMSCDPDLLIADEPTTALDVTIQAQILDLMRNLQKQKNMGMILITHDLGVVAEMCQDVVVMYAGKVVEQGSVEDIFYRPQHPYTKGLLESIPHFESGHKMQRLQTIPGLVPHLLKLPPGCRFADRCTRVQDNCRKNAPELQTHSAQHFVACHYPIL